MASWELGLHGKTEFWKKKPMVKKRLHGKEEFRKRMKVGGFPKGKSKSLEKKGTFRRLKTMRAGCWRENER